MAEEFPGAKGVAAAAGQGGVRTGPGVLRLGTRRSGDDRYEGVIRDGSQVIAACGHPHRNRDTSSQSNGLSARDCITSLARAARDRSYAAHEAARIRRSMDGYIRAYATTASNAAALRENAVRAADMFLSRLPEIAALTGGRPVCGYKDHVAVPPPVPEDVTCLYCRENISPTRYRPGVHGWALPGPRIQPRRLRAARTGPGAARGDEGERRRLTACPSSWRTSRG